jgi:hypothetical protein
MAIQPASEVPQYEDSVEMDLERNLEPERLGEFSEVRYRPPPAGIGGEIDRLLLGSFSPPEP